ncbi:MAG: glycine cleavage system aminomethyltransferase GcvT [Candidatus Lokiarchaeota archaeon]|nr:glycine cleavage system aminomethyltransferase GcvT [Candidatus Lokiarchaeota archaeon]
MSNNLERTHLYDWHNQNGSVVPFAGWEMPVRYSDIREEHMAVRENVGIFDTTHMFRFFISGPDAVAFLQFLTTNNVRKLEVNDGHYSTCLNEDGGTLDDLMLYRVGEQEFIWVTNAANGPKIFKHMKSHADKYDVTVEDRSRNVVMIAVQGPKALSLLNKITSVDATQYSRFTCNPVSIGDYRCYLCRTGYTGEDGGEILLLDTPFDESGKKRATEFWEMLLEEGKEYGVQPCGLGARDSTRLEAGFVLYGHELDEETSPIEAKIPYAVKFKVDPHYIGYDVVKSHKKEGVSKTRIGLVMIDRGIPRENYPVLLNDTEIGITTSGGFSPVLEKGIALAYVPPDVVEIGDTVHIKIRGRSRKAEVVSWPFYDPDKYGSTRKE